MEDDDKTQLKKQIGKRIRKIREEKRLSRQQVAEALEISLANYGYIERGEIDMPMTRLVDIARVFEVSADDLLNCSEKSYFSFNHHNNGDNTNYQVNSTPTETRESALEHQLEKSKLLLQEREKEVVGLKEQMMQLKEINQLLKGEKQP